MPMRRACEIILNDADRTTLERWSRGRSTQARLVTRARVVLAAAEGKENQDIAAELKVSRGAVARWRNRFAESGVAGLEKGAPRGGRPPKISMSTTTTPSRSSGRPRRRTFLRRSAVPGPSWIRSHQTETLH